MSRGRGRAVEMYYTTSQVAGFLQFSETWVRDQIKAGEFGRMIDGDRDSAESLLDVGVVYIDGEYRIAASAVNAFLESRSFTHTPEIAARNLGEMRRRLSGRRAVQTCGQVDG